MKKILIIVLSFISIYSNAQEARKASSKITFSASVGPSFRLAKIPSTYPSVFQNYAKDLKSGVAYDLSIIYNFNKKSGLGLKYSVFQSKASLNNVQLTAPNGDTGFGTTSDNIKFFYVGPVYTASKPMNNGLDDFCTSLSLGYMSYVDDAQVLGAYKIKGSTVGLNFDIAYYFGLDNNFQVGPKFGYFGGTINSFDLTGNNGYKYKLNLTKDNYESLARIDLLAVVRYKF